MECGNMEAANLSFPVSTTVNSEVPGATSNCFRTSDSRRTKVSSGGVTAGLRLCCARQACSPGVCARHCNTEFMKHKFCPSFLRPGGTLLYGFSPSTVITFDLNEVVGAGDDALGEAKYECMGLRTRSGALGRTGVYAGRGRVFRFIMYSGIRLYIIPGWLTICPDGCWPIPGLGC